MLGAQALRTKQKVEQKEREKRLKERKKNMELQRERIQRAANEESLYDYATATETVDIASTSSDDPTQNYCNVDIVSLTNQQKMTHRFHQLAIDSNTSFLTEREDQKNCNRKIHQRHSLNVNTYHQIPTTRQELISYEKVLIPKRLPSSDYGKTRPIENTNNNERSICSKNTQQLGSGYRFLRWLGFHLNNNEEVSKFESAVFSSNNHQQSRKTNNQKYSSNEKRRMSTY